MGRPAETEETQPLAPSDQGKMAPAPEELLVVDDLKPGYDMARAAGVPFAAAGWANDIPEIEGFMRKNCDRYFKTVAKVTLVLSKG